MPDLQHNTILTRHNDKCGLELLLNIKNGTCYMSKLDDRQAGAVKGRGTRL